MGVGQGAQRRKTNRRRWPCIKEIYWKCYQGKGQEKWQLGVSIGEAVAGGGVSGGLKVTSLTLRVQLLLSSSRSPPCRNEGLCSQTPPAFYKEESRLCWCKIP